MENSVFCWNTIFIYTYHCDLSFIYHLPFTHQFVVGKKHSLSTSFLLLKSGQKLGPGRRRPACQIPRCQVEMLTGAVGLEALKIGSFGWGEHENTGLEYSMAVDFFFDVKGRDVRIQMKTKRYTWSWSGRTNLVLFTCCDVFVLFQYCCFNGYPHRVARIIRKAMCHVNQEWSGSPLKSFAMGKKSSANMLQGLIGLNVGCLFVFQPLPLTGRLRMVLASSFLASHFAGMGWFGTQKVVKVFWVA